MASRGQEYTNSRNVDVTGRMSFVRIEEWKLDWKATTIYFKDHF